MVFKEYTVEKHLGTRFYFSWCLCQTLQTVTCIVGGQKRRKKDVWIMWWMLQFWLQNFGYLGGLPHLFKLCMQKIYKLYCIILRLVELVHHNYKKYYFYLNTCKIKDIWWFQYIFYTFFFNIYQTTPKEWEVCCHLSLCHFLWHRQHMDISKFLLFL